MRACSFLAFLGCLILRLSPLLAQEDKYWVRFTDKDQTPYTLQSPEAFLSQRAIERRENHGIPLDEKDLPVDPSYRDSIRAHPSVEVLHSSRWFNAITVHCTDSLHMDSIDTYSFVASKEKVRSFTVPRPTKPVFRAGSPRSTDEGEKSEWHGELDPGEAQDQLSMLGVDHLLKAGYKGQGIRIGVLDAGFPDVGSMDAFSKIFKEGGYIAGFDAVEGDRYPFRGHAHGRAVLSILAAYKEGEMLGAAPEASYILCRTENGAHEYRVEEHNWIAAAEFADSAGVDILSTSLGYTTFDDSTQDYAPSDMDGESTMITKGADIAASRGILVVNSAGNYAQTSWGTIGAPADGDSVLAVGSVANDSSWSSFSSTGPSADGRIKPDVTAMGEGTAFLGGDGKVYRGNGTSFSAPLICGGAATLWSAHPQLKPQELFKLLRKYGHRHTNPNNRSGYGIPDLYRAHLELSGVEMADGGKDRLLSISPNPFQKRVELHLYAAESREVQFKWFDPLGRLLEKESHSIDPEHHHRFQVQAPTEPGYSGLLILEIKWEKGDRERIKLIRTATE